MDVRYGPVSDLPWLGGFARFASRYLEELGQAVLRSVAHTQHGREEPRAWAQVGVLPQKLVRELLLLHRVRLQGRGKGRTRTGYEGCAGLSGGCAPIPSRATRAQRGRTSLGHVP